MSNMQSVVSFRKTVATYVFSIYVGFYVLLLSNLNIERNGF